MPAGDPVRYIISLDNRKFLSELWRARDEAKKAQRDIAAGTGETARAVDAHTAAVSANTSAVAVNTSAVSANTAAVGASAAEHKRLAAEMGVVTVSQNEMDAAWKRIRVAEDAAKNGLEGVGAGMRGMSDLSSGMLQSQQAMTKLLSGNLVGAFKAATSAAISFGKAIALNPLLAAITAVTAAVVVMASKWAEARRQKEEYARNAGALDDAARSVSWARSGTTLSNASDRELAAERERRADLANSAQLDYDVAKERFDATPSDKYREAAEKASEAAIAAWKALDEVEDELDKRNRDRMKSKAERQEAAAKDAAKLAEAQAKLEERQKDLEDTKRYDEIERTGGKQASLEAQRADLQAKLNDPLAFLMEPDKRQDAVEKVYQLEQQIRAEQDKANEAQEEWVRNRRLAAMTEEEQLKTIKAEIEELKKLPRNAENEAKMRGLVDARDKAQKELDKREADAAKDADKDAAKAAEDQAKKQAELEEKKNKFLSRNDTDSMRLRRNREELQAAREAGDEERMLELIEEGEQIAGRHSGPMSRKEMRRAERRAKREERSALREARAYRREVAAVERDFAAGKLSAEEAKKKMPQTEQEKVAGKLDAGNNLLRDIKDLLQ